eukprot:9027498-Pyramimonas_sp.AAC.1
MKNKRGRVRRDGVRARRGLAGGASGAALPPRIRHSQTHTHTTSASAPQRATQKLRSLAV